MRLDRHRGFRIFQKLMRIAPDLKSISRYERSSVPGLLDLHLSVLEESAGYRRIALGQYWSSPPREMMPDPDVSVAVFFEWQVAEALTYQDAYRYEESYEDPSQPPSLERHTQLNIFLESWLDDLLRLRYVLR